MARIIGSANNDVLNGDDLIDDTPSRPGAVGALPDFDENGSASATATVSRSLDQRIDGLLHGVKWVGSSISYSDPDSRSDYQPGYPEALTNFRQISADQLRGAHAALNTTIHTQLAGGIGFSVEGFTNLTIDYAGSGSGAGAIRFVNTSDPTTAYAYYPNSGTTGGDVFFGSSGDFPATGNYDSYTIIHELGHSLGLKHGHEASVYGALPYDIDSMEYSVMTYRSYIGSDAQYVYNETWGYAQTYMMLDIAALQHIYGADFTTNSGNTTYSWSPTTGQSFVNGALAIAPGANRIFETIWDGGGIDAYDLSNYSTSLNIDLNPGGYSTFSSAQRAYLGGGPNGGYARGNVFNALQYQGDARSLIENAYGGSGNDVISGNNANNALYGNAGNDRLYGQSGDDHLYGGEGNDVLYGGLGADKMTGGTGTGSDTFYVDNLGDQITEWSNQGTDAVFSSITYTLAANVENLTLTGSAALNGTGNGLANVIAGNAAANVLSGLDGNDTLNGLGGNDTLTGGNGNDRIIGWDGADRLTGGGGDDRFEFGAASTSPYGAGDRITDFNTGNDTMVIDLVSGTGAFIGTKAFTAGGSIEARYDSVGDMVQVDLSNNGIFGSGDLQILGLAVAPTASGFLFV